MEKRRITVKEKVETAKGAYMPIGLPKAKPRKHEGWDLLESEKQLYGDRCPKGFDKL